MYEPLRHHSPRDVPQSGGALPASNIGQDHTTELLTRKNEHTNFRPTQHSYKPPAIRLISLSLFLVVFAGCICSIEWLISGTVSKDVGNQASDTTTLARRDLITITSYDPPITCLTQTGPDTTCLSVNNLKSRVDNADKIWSDLCSIYSTSFEPYKSQFPVSLESAFARWNESYKDQQDAVTTAQGNLRDCTVGPLQFCTIEWYMVLKPDLRRTVTITQGCARETSIMDPGCRGTGHYMVEAGSIVSTSTLWCGAKMAQQILITTDVARSTSVSSTAQQASKITTTAAPSKTISVQPTATSSIVSIAPTSVPSSKSTAEQLSSQSPASVSSSTTVQSVKVDTETKTAKTPSSSPISTSTSLGSSTRASQASTSIRSSIVLSTSISSSIPITSRSLITNGPTTSATSSRNQESNLPNPTNSQVSASIPSDTATASTPNANFTLSAHEMIVKRPFTYTTYFAATFLPALIAVVLKSLWNIVASSLRMIEPFQRLAGSRGVTAKYSLLTQFLEGAISQDIIQCVVRGRMLPICALLVYAMVEISPLIGSLSMSVKTRKTCFYNNEYRPCDPVWVINMPLIRLLEAFFFLGIALVICLIWLTRKSGIPVASNPSSIVSLASLLNYEPLLLSLQKIDPDADGKLFDAALKKHDYSMGEYHDPKSRQTRFGFLSSQPENSEGRNHDGRSDKLPKTRGEASFVYAPIGDPNYVDESRTTTRRSRISRISWMWIEVLLQFLTTLGLLVLLVIYMLDTDLNSAFNRFFNGDSVPPVISKAVLVGTAIIVDMQIKNLDRTIRITDPFRRLALRNARAETTVLLPLNGTCWSNLPTNLYLLCRYWLSDGRMAWVTFVSLVACLGDANIVAVAGFLFNDAQTREAYYVCGYLCMACTSAILVAVLLTMGWWLRIPVIRRMPRKPDTIGNMLSYLCGSELVRYWNEISTVSTPVESMTREERDALVLQGGRRFCFGRMLGMDERERWSIDYERHESQVMVVPRSW